MGESQSRYSIVERLTTKKLDIMSSKANLGEEVKQKEQKVKEFEKDLENWRKDVGEEMKREERERQRMVDKADVEALNAKELKNEKEKAYDAKLGAVEEALKAIQKISESSPS